MYASNITANNTFHARAAVNFPPTHVLCTQATESDIFHVYLMPACDPSEARATKKNIPNVKNRSSVSLYVFVT